MTPFSRFVGIDWSGDRAAWQRGLRIAVARPGRDAPALVDGPGPGSLWSRTAAVAWIAETAGEGRALIGLDFAFGFPTDPPLAAPLDWAAVEAICGGAPNLYGGAFFGEPRHAFSDRIFARTVKGSAFERTARRRTEVEAARTKGAAPSSPFLAIGPAQVGPSTTSGMRALLALTGRHGDRLLVWPFEPDDGRRSVLVEIFPRFLALSRGCRPAMKLHANLDAALAAYGSEAIVAPPRSEDEGDALLAAAALRRLAGAEQALPDLDDPELRAEGWIFGVPIPSEAA